MTNEILEHFRSLDSAHLLHYAAFEMQDYSQEAQGLLRTALFERGIDESQIRAYRLRVFPFPTMDIDCASCGERLTIERQELNEGKYTCPECQSTEAVPYPEIPIDFEDSSLTGRVIPDGVVLRSDTEGDDSPELASDLVAAVLGQGPESIKLALGNAEDLEDGRLMGEGLPETTCAKCGSVLTPEETFLAAEAFYCEACYEKLTPEERVLICEEEDYAEEDENDQTA